MLKINENYLKLQESYLFSTISKRVSEYSAKNPDKKIIRMGIGDVMGPLGESVVKSMTDAAGQMGSKEGFHGYGPEHGYDFLKDAVVSYYGERDVTLDKDEVFISDGAKSDLGNILDIFSNDNTVLIPDPVYPVYVDTNVMDGRKIGFLNANEANGFLPLPEEDTKGDIIYLCSPNNPTGAVYNREQLKEWVDFANRNGSVILFDAAYEAFVTDGLPRSIFEIEGASTCAIEFCSLSKTAGFTGTRCGYTIVPKELERGGAQLSALWLRRQTTKFNGVAYVVQRAAEAAFTKEGRLECARQIDYYRRNAEAITKTLDELSIWYTGGKNSPYIWLKCPNNMKSWDFFDLLLTKANVVGTPGAGFGSGGEGFFRLTAFGSYENTKEAMERIKNVLKG